MCAQLVSISGIGLSTSLGGYADACAAHRAGLTRFSARDDFKIMSPGDDEPQAVTVSPVNNLFIYQGIAKTIRLIKSAYEDLVGSLKGQPPQDVMVLLALADPLDRELDLDLGSEATRAERLQTHMDALIEPLFNSINPDLNDAPMQAVYGDRIAFARVLKKATDFIAEGKAQHCLLLIADSLLDEFALERQLENNQLKTNDNPVGYIPGEGAAAILVSAASADKSKLLGIDVATDLTADVIQPLNANVDDNTHSTSDSVAAEDTSNKAKFGARLSDLIRKQVSPNEQPHWFPQIYSDMNGTESRAIEYGTLQVKLKQYYPQAHFLPEQIPALTFGETGVLSGALALSMIFASRERGYMSHKEHLIFLSESSGKRASIKVSVS